MKSKRKKVLIAAYCLWIIVCCRVLSADIVYLKNGNTLEGSIVEERDEFIQLQLKSGKISINKDNIEKIEEKKFSIEESRGVIKNSSKNSPTSDSKQAKKKSKKRIAPSEGIGSIHTNNYANKTLEYYYYIPVSVKEGKKRKHPVLVVIPGLGARGETMIMPEIRDFAYDKKCILIAPSFMWDEKNWDSERSYQFPAVWSGQALLDIIKNVSKKNRLSTSKLYLFGHSAGAQFALRFSLWKPELCAACAAHGSGAPIWPTKKNNVKYFVSVGKQDSSRIENMKTFHRQAKKLGINVKYKEYNTGHNLDKGQIMDSLEFFMKIR